MHITRSPRFGAQRSKRLFALELAATTAISVNWLLYIYLVVNGQALQTSIAYLTTPLLNVALGVGMFAAQSVVPEKLRTLDHGRPWSDDQFASTRLSSNRDMSR